MTGERPDEAPTVMDLGAGMQATFDGFTPSRRLRGSRDLMLPAAFDLAVNSPALPYLVRLRVEVVGGSPVCRALTCEQRSEGLPVSTATLRRVAVDRLVTDAILALAGEGMPSRDRTGPPSSGLLASTKLFEAAVRRAQRVRRLTPNHLRSVAEVDPAAGSAPTEAVRAHFGVEPRTASRWVTRARRLGTPWHPRKDVEPAKCGRANDDRARQRRRHERASLDRRGHGSRAPGRDLVGSGLARLHGRLRRTRATGAPPPHPSQRPRPDAERGHPQARCPTRAGCRPARRRREDARSVEAWLQRSRLRVRPSTWDRYSEVCHVHIIPELGKVRLERLTPDQVQRLCLGVHERGRAPRTVRMVRAVLRTALNDARRRRLILTTPRSSSTSRGWSPSQSGAHACRCRGHPRRGRRAPHRPTRRGRPRLRTAPGRATWPPVVRRRPCRRQPQRPLGAPTGRRAPGPGRAEDPAVTPDPAAHRRHRRGAPGAASAPTRGPPPRRLPLAERG